MKTRDYNPPMTKEEKGMYQEINRYYDRCNYDNRLCKSKSSRLCQAVGRFYIVDPIVNAVLALNVDLERLQNEIMEINNNQ